VPFLFSVLRVSFRYESLIGFLPLASRQGGILISPPAMLPAFLRQVNRQAPGGVLYTACRTIPTQAGSAFFWGFSAEYRLDGAKEAAFISYC
jgi:hypothetical protein